MKNILFISLLFCSGISEGQLKLDTTTKWNWHLDTLQRNYYQIRIKYSYGDGIASDEVAYVKNDTLHIIDSFKTIKVLLKIIMDRDQERKSKWYNPQKFEDIKYAAKQ